MKHLYVLIDNGHGYDTPGKCSPDKVIREYKYNRELAAAIYERLSTIDGIEPIFITPERNDIRLSERVRRINKYCTKYGAGNCIMISIHLNAAGGNGQWTNATGWECYTTRKQNNSDKLADIFYDSAKRIFKDKKIRTDYTDGDADKESNFTIIYGANCPAVLTENFFMDSKTDYNYLLTAEGFNNIVALHVDAITNYYKKM